MSETWYLCPIDNCDWKHVSPLTEPSAIVEKRLESHVVEHTTLEYLQTIQRLSGELNRLKGKQEDRRELLANAKKFLIEWEAEFGEITDEELAEAERERPI